MSKTKFLVLEEIGPKLIDNTQLRNNNIIVYYKALQDLKPKLQYSEKVKILARKFRLARKTIEGIICQYTEKRENS